MFSNIIHFENETLAGWLPVVEVKACVANSWPAASGGILRVGEGRGGGHRGEDNLICVKVDANLEWGGIAAGGGVGSGSGGSGPEVATDSWDTIDVSRGCGGVLERSNLKIISIGHLWALSWAESGDACTHRAHRGSLGRVQGGAPNPIRGLSGGGGDVGAVADWAVAPGSPDTDVIILVTQMSLGTGNSWGWGVPVKAGDGS